MLINDNLDTTAQTLYQELFPTLNRNDVHAYGIAIPPLKLQKSFSEKVTKLIYCKEENLSEIEKLQELQGVVLATISSI